MVTQRTNNGGESENNDTSRIEHKRRRDGQKTLEELNERLTKMLDTFSRKLSSDHNNIYITQLLENQQQNTNSERHSITNAMALIE